MNRKQILTIAFIVDSLCTPASNATLVSNGDAGSKASEIGSQRRHPAACAAAWDSFEGASQAKETDKLADQHWEGA